MNLILVDADCKNLFPDGDQIRVQLKEEKAEIIYLDVTTEFIENQCRLHLAEKDRQWKRCILLTVFNGGIQKYHQMLLKNNCFLSWVITVLDVQYESLRQQYLNQVDTMLAESKLKYKVLFDNARDLKKTCLECKRLVRDKKMCLVLSYDKKLAETVSELIVPVIPEWEIMQRTELTEEEADDANAILILEKTDGALHASPVKSGMNKVFFWFEETVLGQCKAQRVRILQELEEKLLDDGWNLYDGQNIFYSHLSYEQFHWQLEQKIITAAALKNDETFVIWDRFGLPVRKEEYTMENIEQFLRERSCFGQLCKLL